MSKRSPRLQFTEEERAAPDLKKAIHEIGYEVLDQKSEEVTKKKWGLF